MGEPRFRHLNVVWELAPDWCESDHLREALEIAESELVPLGLAEQFHFVVTSYGDRLPLKHRDRVVVLQTSDEGHEIPDYLDDVFMVFKNYRPFAPLPDTLRIIPLGCNKDVPALPARPIADRRTDAFFIGRKEFRDDFFAAALPLNDRTDLAARIEIGSDFRKGIAPEDYAAILADTKIALSPRGVSHETFRTYEALRAGCVVLAARHLPSWFTTGWPVIECDDWTGLNAAIDALLADPAKLEALSLHGVLWWEERCSPRAVGRYIVRELATQLLKRRR